MNRQEFAALIEKEGNAVYTFCCHLTGSREYADDLYQETMLAAVERLSKIDRSGNPKSLLMGIAAGKWKNHKRKNARRQRIAPKDYMDNEESWIELKDTGMNPEESYLSSEMCRLVRMETAALEEKYKIPLYLFYSLNMTVEEIAKALHIPGGTVKSRLHKARTILIRKMEDHGYE